MLPAAEDAPLDPPQFAAIQCGNRLGFKIPIAPRRRACDERGARDLSREPEPGAARLNQGKCEHPAWSATGGRQRRSPPHPPRRPHNPSPASMLSLFETANLPSAEETLKVRSGV